MKTVLIVLIIVFAVHCVLYEMEKNYLEAEIKGLRNDLLMQRELLNHYEELVNIHAENLAELNAKVMTLEQRPTVVLPVAKKAKVKKEE